MRFGCKYLSEYKILFFKIKIISSRIRFENFKSFILKLKLSISIQTHFKYCCLALFYTLAKVI